MIRAFIALELSAELRAGLEGLIRDLEKGIRFTPARPLWVHPEAIHLTLKFLGSIEEARIPEIEGVLKEAADGAHPFMLRALGLGVFPDPRAPRVLWCGLSKGEKQTRSLQTHIERALSLLGFEKEDRPFHPHLTLARIKSVRGAAAMMNIVGIHKNRQAGECLVDRVILYQSQLHPSGAVYTPLVTAPFAPAPNPGDQTPQRAQ